MTPTVASSECDEKAEVALYASKLVTWISSDVQNAIRNILHVFCQPRTNIVIYSCQEKKDRLRTQHKQCKVIALSMSSLRLQPSSPRSA